MPKNKNPNPLELGDLSPQVPLPATDKELADAFFKNLNRMIQENLVSEWPDDPFQRIKRYITMTDIFRRLDLSHMDEEAWNKFHSDFGHAVVRLLISTPLTGDILKSSQWQCIVHYDFANLKSIFLVTLRRNDDLRVLLNQQKDRANNAFLVFMRTPQSALNNAFPKDHLMDTNHGAEVALIMQWTDEFSTLKGSHDFAVIQPNAIKLRNESDDAAIQAFIQPHITEVPPDLVALVKQLATGSLSFKKKADVISVFLDEMSAVKRTETLNTFFSFMMRLGSNAKVDHLYQALYTQMMPLFAYVAIKTERVKNDAWSGDSKSPLLTFFARGENKTRLVDIFEFYPDIFLPLVSPEKKTVFDAIIDAKKWFAGESGHRTELNAFIEKYKALKSSEAAKPPSPRRSKELE